VNTALFAGGGGRLCGGRSEKLPRGGPEGAPRSGGALRSKLALGALRSKLALGALR